MKKLLIAGTLLLTGFITCAQTITRGCWSNGRYSLTVSGLTIGQTMHITTTGFDTTITNTSTIHTFTVPQPVRTTTREITIHHGSGCTTEITTGINACLAMAIKQVVANYSVDSDGTFTFYLTVDDDTDVNHYVIKDRITGKSYLIMFPDDRKGTKTYIIKLPK